jgi:hypothetical protein
MRNRAFLKVVLLGLLTFAFVPGLAGAASQGQDLTGMLSSSAAERAVAVSGPIISVTPSSHDFGRVNVGSSSGNFDFTIMNTGDATLNISSLTFVGDPGFTGSAVSLSIVAGGSTLLHTSFTPGSSGNLASNLSINSNASNGTFSALLHGIGNTAPTFSPPLAASYNASAFVVFSLTASATDAEGDAVTYTIASVPALPVGATFDGNSGAISWTPNSGDVGDYAVTVTATDGLASTPGAFTLHVTSSNNPPVANVGGPYSGVTGIPIAFNGSASSDPDAGQTITFAWDFGDGGSATSATPSHTYASPDNGSPVLSNTATTTSAVVNFIPITLVQPTGTAPVVKTNGQGVQRFGIECLTRSVVDIDPTSIRISTTFPNAGTVSEVAISPKGIKVGDINGNGFGDLDFQFRASEIKPLLIHVPNGTLVTLVFTAKTISDAVTLRGTIDLTKSGSANVTSAVAGNPFKLQTSIQYTLRDSGPVQIRIYSVNGQLVRTLREELATPGAYEVRWNGKDDGGRTSPSGIYFVSVKQGTESSQTRVVLER